MEALLGTSLPVFIGFTLLLVGYAAFMTGVGLAGTWRPLWQVPLYCLLLGAADRFLVWSLFGGAFLASGYVVDTLLLTAIGLFSYRLTLARMMVIQYPWLYERSGILSWRDKVSD